MKDSLIKITSKLLTRNKIKYDKKELAFQIQSHPSYPSLHAITGVLTHFNIENIAAEVPIDQQTLAQLPNTFIAQIETDKGKDLVTASKTKDGSQYTISSSAKKDTKISKSEFLQQFTGIIVAVEKTEDISEIKKDSNPIVNLILSCIIVSIIGFLISQNITSAKLVHIILSILGIIISYIIIKQELGKNTVIGDAFCSGLNEKKDCDAVLNSEGAEIIKGHKLSDFSILFFSGLTITSLVASNFNLIYVISFLAIPITVYSIYYQAQIIKSWCTLCLSIVGILWLQALLAFITTRNFSSLVLIDNNNILIGTLSFLSVYLIWRFTKPLVKEVNELKQEKIEFTQFKRNFVLFNSMLQKSPKLNTTILNNREIVFGNKNATLEIVIITNPFCGHCKPVHKLIHDILHKYSRLVKIVIRFNVAKELEGNQSAKVANILIDLYHTKGEGICKTAMDEIYENGNYKQWLNKWGKETTQNHLSILEDEKEWCVQNNINFTPEILINGLSFPSEYARTDLIYFIEDLEEETRLVEISN